ncbi:MAG TPA: adenylate/guanylate cyclase domain-containing protein [Opitutaceae bacterium]|nr:adenylate/guanylate cyclase domain-containing protein [Opitutaceae bacterium]
MTPDTPAPGASPSQRTLAAIVFTDVVSFSARMHSDEVGTLKLLQRDFAEMRRLCAEYEGAVLKTTGDGLLLTFTSAVQAVACALAMQRQFAAEAKGQLPGGALQHRIGIHLGDVLVQDKDVMGDGVNIASRLQAEAEPGGICISQTVYDVVRNKLEMKVVSLGARDLKNIAQAMPVYRLILEAQTLDPASKGGSPASRPPASRRRRVVLLAIGAAAALAVALGAVAFFLRRAQGNSRAASTAATPSPAPAAASAAPGPLVQAAGGAGGNGDAARPRAVMQQIRALYLEKYDFSGMVIALRDKAEGPSAPLNLQLLLRSGEQLVRMKAWLDNDLRRHGPQHPLLVHDLSGDATRDASVYLAADERLIFLEGGTPRPREWTNVKPAELGAIIVSAVREAKDAPRPVLGGAQAFARLYALPSMTVALDSIRARNDKDAAAK